jgi:hypothetical protein
MLSPSDNFVWVFSRIYKQNTTHLRFMTGFFCLVIFLTRESESGRFGLSFSNFWLKVVRDMFFSAVYDD